MEGCRRDRFVLHHIVLGYFREAHEDEEDDDRHADQQRDEHRTEEAAAQIRYTHDPLTLGGLAKDPPH